MKGKYGVNLTVVAILCIAFAALRQPIPVILICGYAILAEKNVRLNKSVLFTAILMVLQFFINLIISGFFRGIARVLTTFDIDRVANWILGFASFVNTVVYIAFLIVYIILMVYTIKGKEIKFSLINKLVSDENSEEEKTE